MVISSSTASASPSSRSITSSTNGERAAGWPSSSRRAPAERERLGRPRDADAEEVALLLILLGRRSAGMPRRLRLSSPRSGSAAPRPGNAPSCRPQQKRCFTASRADPVRAEDANAALGRALPRAHGCRLDRVGSVGQVGRIDARQRRDLGELLQELGRSDAGPELDRVERVRRPCAHPQAAPSRLCTASAMRLAAHGDRADLLDRTARFEHPREMGGRHHRPSARGPSRRLLRFARAIVALGPVGARRPERGVGPEMCDHVGRLAVVRGGAAERQERSADRRGSEAVGAPRASRECPSRA